MQWKDLFYFSQGERRGLTLLLILITLSWVILYYPTFRDNPSSDNPGISQVVPIDTIIGNSSPKKEVTEKPVKDKTSWRTSSSLYEKQEKFSPGTIVDLNSADTTTLKKVPGIGSTFANRIIKYRNLLGGFYSVDQLAEVFGIDEERFHKLSPWFHTDKTRIIPININKEIEEELRKHPYITPRQAKAIIKLRKQKGTIQWENLLLLEEFTEYDKERLRYYIE